MLALALISQLLAAGPTQLTIDVKPEGVVVMLDGKPAGKSGDKPIVKKVKPGKHVVRLSHKGDSHEEEVSLKNGENKTYAWAFEGSKPTAAPTDEVPAAE